MTERRYVAGAGLLPPRLLKSVGLGNVGFLLHGCLHDQALNTIMRYSSVNRQPVCFSVLLCMAHDGVSHEAGCTTQKPLVKRTNDHKIQVARVMLHFEAQVCNRCNGASQIIVCYPRMVTNMHSPMQIYTLLTVSLMVTTLSCSGMGVEKPTRQGQSVLNLLAPTYGMLTCSVHLQPGSTCS